MKIRETHFSYNTLCISLSIYMPFLVVKIIHFNLSYCPVSLCVCCVHLCKEEYLPYGHTAYYGTQKSKG